MKLLNKLKLCAVINLMAGVSMTQAFAQVTTNRMACLDIGNGISYEVHFQGNQVILNLKAHTYRLPYIRAFVSPKGERWSVYGNQEIRVLTTIPYDRYVAVTTPSGNPIADSFECN